MDLNHISLPGSLIEDLYKNHLTESGQPPPAKKNVPVPATDKQGIQYLGKNQKGVCLLVSYPADVYLPDEQLSFLTSILQACQLNLGDVAIINCQQQKISFEMLKEQVNCKYLLAFGVTAASIGLPETGLFSIQQTGNCFIVYAPPAEQLNSNQPESKQLKSKLWNCLKQLFVV